MQIFIVEDEKALSQVLKDEFISHGFDVDVAYDGVEAMEKMGKSKPDLVLLDILLPKMNGFEVLKSMKADDTLKDIPIIILSNLDQDEESKKGLAMGADDYYVKSQHTLKEIVEKVNRFLVRGERT